MLDFPVFGQGREMMALAHVSHAVIAVLLHRRGLRTHLYRHTRDGGRGPIP